MMRLWIAVVWLAGTWMHGRGCYQPANVWWWALLAAAGLGCLMDGAGRTPPRRAAIPALILLLPVVAWLSWPLRGAAAILAAGLLLSALPPPRGWVRRIGAALVEGGLILAVQALVLPVYEWVTGWSHELPAPMARGLMWLARGLGMTVSYDGQNLAIFTMRKVHMLGATWELLLDPVSLAFLAGALMLLALRGPFALRSVLRLLVVVLVWLPVRAGLQMSVLVHRALLTDYDAPLRVMNQFWSPWLPLALAAVPAFLAWRFVRLSRGEPDEGSPGPRWWTARESAGWVLASAGAAVCAAGMFFDPVGARKPGRILMDEYHTTWEPSQRPFDTTWYGHDAGYNYACIYDYCSRFYDMGRLTNRIDDAAVRDVDVLILKVPTSAYEDAEIDAIRRFVERGGGILLIGEHTDVFMTTSHLNQVARAFDFEFRRDSVFGIRSPFEELYRPPPFPHPILQYMPYLEFEVSCSIRPRVYSGRAVIRNVGLWDLPADYHASNFYPQVEDRADARYGAFIQLWTTRQGAGRVAAFADSTVFSNFSTFEPGKTELMIGMLEWLNHTNRLGDPRLFLLLLGVAMAAAGIWVARRRFEPVLLIAAGLFAFQVTGAAVRRHHAAAMPFPKALRPFTLVVIDRTASSVGLSKCGFIKATPESYGIFEQSILRLGYFTSRRSGDDEFAGDALVFFQPDKPVTEAFRARLTDYVKAGGKVLVIDSALNASSRANSLLYPFGLAIETDSNLKGTLEGPEGWPAVPAESAVKVTGGDALVRLSGQPVAARTRFGKGLVVAVGFGNRFSDDCMGVTTDIDPSPETRRIYELEYALLRTLVGEK